MLEVIVIAFWSMLPAYVPNNAAVLFGGGRPIDGGRIYNGRRLLGDGKTWRGTAAGTLAGIAVALVLNVLATPLPGYLPTFPVTAVFTLPAGAMVGDIAASLIKRRTGRDRGAAMPGLDQLDFVVGSLSLTAIIAPAWFSDTFTIPVLLVIVVFTPLFHLGLNVIAYRFGWKDEPY
ncbi:CDP-2,3-bis-(O-geranylgeranyl)-sn-glycerol synthase [Halocatena pleomorpha]|uniref:CDP-archaeol synthase n=1 Tax=Halocatena pleomorpha TaxID=1785090 RepID=A0A3P3R8B3_9EURY|nr:CDP-2,3-bis-(O-geranylgeranyl)-sn-glycerol synthase [Halocatena pleomorpha]RRJ29169.1 CDP-2,3-bis-(O-geranylgeranyl)-sn-glycerol synthase [Halocatena pleomorpha]